MKPSEEIKWVLEIAKTNCLHVECCEDICPYNKNCDVSDPDAMAEIPREIVSDALAYIQQLDRERDAAVYYIATKKECKTCKHFSHKASDEPCRSCGIGQSHWEWRGVEEDDHGKNR